MTATTRPSHPAGAHSTANSGSMSKLRPPGALSDSLYPYSDPNSEPPDNATRSSSSPHPAPRAPRRILPGVNTQKTPRTARSRTPQPETQQSESSLGESRIGIIGAGAMGGALCRGLVNSRIVAPNRIIVSDPHSIHVQELARSLGIIVAENNLQVANNSDIIVLAV